MLVLSNTRLSAVVCCLGESVTRPGERISPKRDDVLMLRNSRLVCAYA